MKLRADLHIHSCLSPCGSDDMTPNNIVNMAVLAGYDVIAVTDHNSTCNCAALMELGRRAGISVVPAMELTTAEEVHVLMYMPDIRAAEKLCAIVYDALPQRKNRPSVFGAQPVLDENDRLLRQEDKLLAAAAGIGVYKAAELARSLGGIAVPAHIDRASFSLLSNMGLVDPAMGFTVFEVTRGCRPESLFHRPGLEGRGFITGSDAHDLAAMPDPFFHLEADSSAPEDIIRALEQLTVNVRT